MNLEDVVWDQMAQARDVKVRTRSADADGVTYEISLAIKLDRSAWSELSEKAGERGQRITSLLRCYVAKGLRNFMSADDTAPT